MKIGAPPIALLALLLSGCSYAPWGEWFPDAGQVGCTNDSQCSSSQVCFVDGCGDPGENLAVEVVPQQGTGEAQDFVLDSGELRAFQIINLYPSAAFEGTISRSTIAGPEPYLGNVSISIRGESTVIPGIRRRYDAVSTTNTSTYSAQVGAGSYTLTARATDDVTVPPVVIRNLQLGPGQALEVPIVFPGGADVVTLSGFIYRTEAQDAVQAALDVQVVERNTGEALSQRVPVSASGAFSVTTQFPRGGTPDVLIQVTAREANALVPRRQFPVNLENGLSAPLIFGDFGSAVSVSGRVLDALAKPVSGARVSLSGTVDNTGTFQTAAALTGVDGSFQLQTLATLGSMTLTVVPPADTTAGITLRQVYVPFLGGNLSDVVTAIRPEVVGRVRRPDNTTPAAGIRLVAEPLFAVADEPLPTAIVETRTDLEGKFRLRLDPAVYRLDLFPGENLPRISRFATVGRTLADGVPTQVTLPDFELSAGRTVEGVVSIVASGGDPRPAANATVRFFRLTPYDSGQPGALLLAEGVANASGEFKVVLPTR